MFADEHSLIGFRPDIWDLIAFASLIGAIVLEQRISGKRRQKGGDGQRLLLPMLQLGALCFKLLPGRWSPPAHGSQDSVGQS